MAIEQVREYFRKAGIEERIQEFEAFRCHGGIGYRGTAL